MDIKEERRKSLIVINEIHDRLHRDQIPHDDKQFHKLRYAVILPGTANYYASSDVLYKN